jgi:hypothetical protein
MSPDNGRPLQHLTQTNGQRSADENIETLERSKSTSRTQVISHRNFFFFSLSIHSRILLLISYNHNRDESKLSLWIDIIYLINLKRSPVRQPSSTNRKRRSPSPQPTTISNIHSRHRTPQNSSPPTSSSES